MLPTLCVTLAKSGSLSGPLSGPLFSLLQNEGGLYVNSGMLTGPRRQVKANGDVSSADLISNPISVCP